MITACRIPVKNRDRAIAFYSALLAVDVERQTCALQFNECDEHPFALLHFDVADRLDEALAIVWTQGGKILELPAEKSDRTRCAVVMDCEGNRVTLYTQE